MENVKSLFTNSKARFLLSAAIKEQFPEQTLPEIAFIGRSNVGKSSLLNHLTSSKNLAKTSSTPGKTQLINFFDLDKSLSLVDLPGYGFAKVSKKIKGHWAHLIEDYLQERENLNLLLLLVDLRHPPTKDDLEFAAWAKHFNKPFLLVFTKSDKLSRQKQAEHSERNLREFLQTLDMKSLPHVNYSIKDAKGRDFLLREIQNYL